MGWVVADSKSTGHFDSATDGDLDIAYSLLLAHKQWGSQWNSELFERSKRHDYKRY